MEEFQKNKCKNIGVLINSIDGFYQSLIWKGIKKTAEEKNLNLLFFAGQPLNSPIRDELQHNFIYNLVNINKLDGLIISSGAISNFIGMDEFVEFIEKYKKIPMVSIALAVKDIPSIVIDNKNSMYLMVNHLIERHKYSKIAFITGPVTSYEAVQRLQGYEQSLYENNIEINRKLIIEGTFSQLSGSHAIDLLYQNNDFMPQVIVSSNDEMAIGACLRLKQLGFEVGKDIFITGFDNVEGVRNFSPPITTVSQNIFEMASRATGILNDIIDGKEVPICTYLNGDIIIRESCGCNENEEEKLQINLIDENILLKREVQQQFNFRRMYKGTRDIIKEFNSAIYMSQLTQVVFNALELYDFKKCYLCVYDEPVKNFSSSSSSMPSNAKLVFGYTDGIIECDQTFNLDEMLPSQIICQYSRNELIFYPLFSGEDQFGYIALSLNAIDEYVYETFREQISNTIKIQSLFNERKKVEEKLNLAVKGLAKLNEELHGRTLVDELTGLYNRRGFYKNGENFYNNAAIRDKKFILCFGDIDNLKEINDNFGHEVGDNAILTTAQLLRKSFRNDDIIARIGGDEFIMIVKMGSSEEDIKAIKGRIKNNFDEYNLDSKELFKLTISLGFSIYTPSSNYSLKELINQADEKLYDEKKKKKYIINII